MGSRSAIEGKKRVDDMSVVAQSGHFPLPSELKVAYGLEPFVEKTALRGDNLRTVKKD